MHRKPIDSFENEQSSLLVLTSYNDTARSFRSFFNRRMPLWEGHTRSGLENLVNAVDGSKGDCGALAVAVVRSHTLVAESFPTVSHRVPDGRLQNENPI
jgi:DNA helicase-2/ATP-dependent DNA helicase PcrA